MAYQDGVIKLKGKVGDLSFYKTKDGYLARKKGGASAKQIKNDPRYQRTRENMVEFGEVCTASKKIRTVVRDMILLAYDPKMAQRLTARVYRMMKLDTTSLRGQRQVKDQSLSLLKGFNFNEMAPFNNTLLITPLYVINREAGSIDVHISKILPSVHLVSPKGATHFRISLGAAIINLTQGAEKSGLELAATNYIQTTTPMSNILLNCSLLPNLIDPIVIFFGINFYKELNGTYYSLNNDVYNSLSVVEVNVL